MILIGRYLPEKLVPDLHDVRLGEFYGLLAKAKQARKLYQQDITKGFVDALNLLFTEE